MGVFGYASDTCLRLGRAYSMTKKQILLYGLAAVVLAVLVYMQFRTWRNFDWPTFLSQTDEVNKSHIFHAIALIYLAYVMRAIRWKIFLRPVRPRASAWGLVAPTLIGFTGLAMLGRPGERSGRDGSTRQDVQASPT